MAVCLILCLIPLNASAYNLQIGKLTGGIANRKYYIGMTNQTYITACISGMNAWNYALQNSPETANMGVNFTRTYTLSQAAFQFYGEYLPNQSFAATTRYYYYDKDGNAISATNAYHRDFAVLVFNTTKAPTENAVYMASIAAHEVGHGLGLHHNTTDFGTLMFQGVNARTAHAPTRDEVLGIYEKYS